MQKVQRVFLSQAKLFVLTFTSFSGPAEEDLQHRGVHWRGTCGYTVGHCSSCLQSKAVLPIASWTKRARR